MHAVYHSKHEKGCQEQILHNVMAVREQGSVTRQPMCIVDASIFN